MGGRPVGTRLALALVIGLAVALLGAPGHARPTDATRAAPAQVTKPAKPAKPVVKKVKPRSGPSTGGTVVRIKGKNFVKVKKVLFGKTRGTNLRVKSKRKIVVVAPPHAAGTVPVRVVAKAGKSKKSRKARFTYRASTPVPSAPVVTGLAPDSGPVAGGTTVDVSGSGLTGATGVSFGGAAATFTVLSDALVRVTTPAHAAGPVPVTVQTPGGTSAPVTFTYESAAPPPLVVLVAPLTGSESGGTAVTITGTGFTGATAVTFGGNPATSVTVDSDTQISAVTPAHEPGLVAVSVTTPQGTSTVPGLFTYLPLPPLPPVVVVVAPLTGSESGGTAVTITGTGLTGATAVTFGGTAATSFTVDSDTQISAVTPAHEPGLVAVSVTTPDGTSTVPGLFTYLPLPPSPPVVVLVTPAVGSSTGGQTVVITGTGLSGATAVEFGGTPAPSFTVNSDLQITATTPAHALGLVDVSVTTPGGTSIGIGLFLYLL